VSVFSPTRGDNTRQQGHSRGRSGRGPKDGADRAAADALGDMLQEGIVAKVRGRQWKRAHRRRVFTVDVIILLAVVSASQIIQFAVLHRNDANVWAAWQRAAWLSVVLVVLWLILLELQNSRNILLAGAGAEEYGRVVSATMWLFGITAASDLLFHLEESRGYVSIVVVLGLFGLLIGRHWLRRNLERLRRNGEVVTRVVILGKQDSIQVVCECFGRAAEAGYRVVGACIPDFDGEVGEQLRTPSGDVQVLGDVCSLESALTLTQADAVVIAAVEHLGYRKMKELLWRLESLGVDLIVVPGLTDVAAPRLKMQPIDNLPLFHIAPPHFDGPSAAAKRSFDLVFATAALLAAMPVLLVAAVAIKLDSGGPIIFRQQRIGHHGNVFRIFKLRTMTVDADAQRQSIQAVAGVSGVFYKSASDSRITRVGRFLRATSIDELPQLLNVLGGSMSVVGPRPLVAGEGAAVEHFVERRGLVKPGMTGLWQISGRSDAPEEERIRLDFSYVDNWSCVQDLVIVWHTVRAVLKRDGAY
jgi:exopolysaccharide biosynthesis polyprenyl glycosylphosphotransferase